MNPDCRRCEYLHHEYENSLCPRDDRFLQDLAFMDGQNGRDYYKAIDECDFMEWVHAPISQWTKKKILDVCKTGGASRKTLGHIEHIPLDDLKAILLVKLAVIPRGMYSEIWHECPKDWEHVRHTQMWGINWPLIDSWNESL